jgi:hypothetical protein
VALSLPFLSTHVTFDDDGRILDPPTDVVAFDVRDDSAVRHRVSATSVDGTSSEGFVQEEAGIARFEGDGYTLSAPPRSGTGDVCRAAVGRESRPIGTVRNGFTKLR